jgi:hypothetical protein
MPRWILVFLFLCIGSFAWAQQESLKPFETDYCTLFPEGTAKQPELWKQCCFEHDLRYWFGGSFANRDVADTFLKQCVQEVAGSFWANAIYDGVRRGHSSPIKNRLHWGWGWTSERDNSPLTTDEKALIRHDLYELGLDPAYVKHFILKYGIED